MATNWEQFYATNAKPTEYDQFVKEVKTFCDYHLKCGNKIVLVTSGGTTVPLEHNTVRFVDNFSAGTRGSSSVEYFISKGYAVIFLYRFKSLEPFVRHFTGQKFLDLLQINQTSISVKDVHIQTILPILSAYQDAKVKNQLLSLHFTTLSDYLWLLRAVCCLLKEFHSKAMLYLAAAVSDFYIPSDQMPEHKMQSDSGAPTIALQLVPKMLEPLVSLWVPHAFVVSFKLETDENLLIPKARASLKKYKHKVVIANILQTRKIHVVFVTPEDSEELQLSMEEIKSGVEIESKIVNHLFSEHMKHIRSLDTFI